MTDNDTVYATVEQRKHCSRRNCRHQWRIQRDAEPALVSGFSGKSLKLLPPDVRFFRLKYTKFAFRWGSAPDPAWGAYRAAQTPSCI